ncbi:unnamed protein product [Gadus morhua 'NCC']
MTTAQSPNGSREQVQRLRCLVCPVAPLQILWIRRGGRRRWRCKPLTTVAISQGEEVDLLGPLQGGHRDSEQSTNLSEYFPLREGPGRLGPLGLGRWSSDWPEPEQGPQAPLASVPCVLCFLDVLESICHDGLWSLARLSASDRS